MTDRQSMVSGAGHEVLVIRDDEVKKIISHALARQIARDAAIAYSAGQAEVPPRIHLTAGPQGEALVMPGFLPRHQALGLKAVMGFPGNIQLGLPAWPACMLMIDPGTGMPAALINATFLTLVRTAAMSAVAAEHLAVEDPASLGVIGAGAQAQAHIDAFADRFPLQHVRIFSRTRERAEYLARRARASHPTIEITVADSAAATVDCADIVLAATTSDVPVFPADRVGPGQFVCGVGSHRRGAAELPPQAVSRAARIVVDTRVGAVDGAGDIAPVIASGALSSAEVSELGEVLAGLAPGRSGPQELCVFKSAGFAAVDLLAGKLILDRAVESGLGSKVRF